ncbi:MAG: hypothetical protein ACOX5R_12235 [bacterium]
MMRGDESRVSPKNTGEQNIRKWRGALCAGGKVKYYLIKLMIDNLIQRIYDGYTENGLALMPVQREVGTL